MTAKSERHRIPLSGRPGMRCSSVFILAQISPPEAQGSVYAKRLFECGWRLWMFRG